MLTDIVILERYNIQKVLFESRNAYGRKTTEKYSHS